MSVVELIPLDKGHRLILDNSVVTTVGRTPNIGCLDKKISRNHAEFHIKPDGTAWIKPIHHNPTFLRTKTSQLITLTKDEEFQLHDNDEIGLLPTEYFYRISIKRPDDPTPEERIEEKPSSPPPQNQPFSPAKDHDDPNVEPEGGVILHTTRALPAWMSGSSVVEPKPSKGKGKQSASTTPTKTPSPNKYRTCNYLTSHPSLDESVHASLSPLDIGRKKAEGLTYEDDEEPEEEASTTPPRANRDNPSKRERCPYGKFCYRKNPQHRQQAIHPGDPDWSDKENTTDGSKPVCPYGSDCYRKNPDHFNEYDHTQKATATNKPKQRTSKRKGKSAPDTRRETR